MLSIYIFFFCMCVCVLQCAKIKIYQDVEGHDKAVARSNDVSKFVGKL